MTIAAAAPAGPACPFCGAGWTEAMLAQLDAMSSPVHCSCCHGDPVESAALPAPTEDLCCAACSRAIYLKPAAVHR